MNEERASWNLQGAAFTKPRTLNELHVLPMSGCFRPKQKSTSKDIRDDFTSQLNSHHVRAVAGYVPSYNYTSDGLESKLQV